MTLSACETALGRRLEGEGVIGLATAFQYAGARSVVASLWRVADLSTARLMEVFYRCLARGMAKDEALREAQLALARAPIRDDDERLADFSNPYHWAAFQLIGDWR